MFNKYPSTKYTTSSTKLIKQQKLVFNTFGISHDIPITVISSVALNQTDKSNLFKVIGPYILHKNIQIINIDKSEYNITFGIDMYYFEKTHIIFLDFQGLRLDTMLYDFKLWLIVHSIVDVMIYN